jgi:hypothetical protein
MRDLIVQGFIDSQAFYFLVGYLMDELAWARKMTIDDTPRALHTRYM